MVSKNISAWTFCPTKTKIVQTNVNFGRKMSDVRPLFQALVGGGGGIVGVS